MQTISRQSICPGSNGGIRVNRKITLLNYKALLKLLCSWLGSISVHVYVWQVQLQKQNSLNQETGRNSELGINIQLTNLWEGWRSTLD
jgi:hypothetical protein